MASYNGILVELPHRAEDILRCSASIQSLSTDPIVFPPEEIESVLPIGVGTKTYVQQDELETVYDGKKVDSFLDDYYYRIHISPATFNLGAILNPLSEEFIVWNAWFVSKTCSSINKVNPEEFTLSGLTAPFGLSPLSWTTYILGIPMEGSLEFESSITFVFSDENLVVTITGTRVTIFPYEPLLPMKETLEWKTDVMRSRDGSEQRMSIRQVPRQMFDFDVFLENEQLQSRFDAKLFGWQKRTWGVPIWAELEVHTSSILIDDTTIYLDTNNADYRDDSTAIIWQSPTSYEAIKIATVESDRLNLDLPIRNNWTGKKWIMPLRIANMHAHTTRKVSPDKVGRVQCSFLVQDNVLLTGFVADTTYLGIPVITVSTLTDGELDIEVSGDIDFVDYGLGKFQMFSDSDFNITVQNHIIRRNNKADCWDFRLFLHSLYGRRGTAWVLTDRKDLQQQNTIGAAETVFNIDNIKLADNMGLNAMRTHLAFVFPDGTYIYREITGITESDDNTEIVSINSALGVEVHVGDCEICFLDKVRLSDDTVELTWEESNSLHCSLSMTRIVE